MVDEIRRQLVTERLAHASDRAIRLRRGHREADRAFGRGLEDRRDREALRVDRRERARRDPVHADHAFAGNGHDRLAVHDGDRFDRIRA